MCTSAGDPWFRLSRLTGRLVVGPPEKKMTSTQEGGHQHPREQCQPSHRCALRTAVHQMMATTSVLCLFLRHFLLVPAAHFRMAGKTIMLQQQGGPLKAVPDGQGAVPI